MHDCHVCGASDLYAQNVKLNSELLPLGPLSVPEATVVVCGSCGNIRWQCKPHTLDEVRARFAKAGSGK